MPPPEPPLVAVAAPRMRRIDGCPVCGHEKTAFSFASPDLLHGVPGLYAFESCLSCGSFFQNPRARDQDLSLCYPGGYFTHAMDPGPGSAISAEGLRGLLRRLVLRSQSTRHRARLDVAGWCGRVLHRVGPVRRRAMFGLVDEVRPPSTLDRCLELGPGKGDDMWRLSQLGWAVTGLDLDPQAAEVATARSGAPVVVGSILDHRPDLPYGLIYSSHSIEHVPDLRATIAHLRSLLGDGGQLVMVVPNARSISARAFGPLSIVWDPPRHLSLPSAAALRTLLCQMGFGESNVRTISGRGGRYCAIARARRQGVTGVGAWDAPTTRGDRALHALEALLVRLGLDVGEEIVASATV